MGVFSPFCILSINEYWTQYKEQAVVKIKILENFFSLIQIAIQLPNFQICQLNLRYRHFLGSDVKNKFLAKKI